MAPTKQVRKVKCPHPECGWIRVITIDVEGGKADVVAGYGDAIQGASEALKKTLQKFTEMLNNSELDEANAWLPMPPCPHCKKEYEYNLHTGKTRL